MSASSGTLRTYGKRPRVESSNVQETSKRRKVSEDPVIRTASPTERDADTDTDVEFIEESPKSRVSRTYGTPSGTPSKLVRDLSGIFATMSPSSSLTAIRSPATTPTKLAKRMLGRSKTESSVESRSPSDKDQQGKGVDRTSSMPNLSSSSSAHLTPDRLPSSSSTLSLSRPTIFPTSKGSTTRTYAGKYRSFLMALPASPSGSSKDIAYEDEFETRESYNSLRSRWGVDNSEDDPHPSYDISSPSNSMTTASEASPSRNGNGQGKGKATSRTVPVPNGMMNPLKSISELRNKGEIRRFLDEVGYLFEGLDPKCGIALRRSSALEITTKLCDPEFTRKAKAADFFGKTWELLLLAGAGKGEDKILDILLVFFLALIARDPVSLAELAERPTNHPSPSIAPSESHERTQDTSLVDILILILETVYYKGDLLALSDQSGNEEVKRPLVPKKDRTILLSIIKVITTKSYLFPPCTPISIPLLIAMTLQTLPPSCLSASCLPTLLNSLRKCLSPHPNPGIDLDASSATTTLYSSLSSESKWLDIVKCVPYESVYHHLKLVDAYLVGQWAAIGHGPDPDQRKSETEAHRFLDRARDEWMVRDLVAFGICCELKVREEENEGEGDDNKSDSDDVSLFTAHQKCFKLTLRVLISLTHNDNGWASGVVGCEMTIGLILRTTWKFGRELLSLVWDESVSEVEEAEGGRSRNENERDGGSHAFDTLCLVLGLLTNLVQVVNDAKNVVRRSRLDPSCALRNRACLKRCVCAQKPRKEKNRRNGKERSGVEVLVWLYDQLQLQREGGVRQRGNHHERTREQEQENEAQSSFLCGNLAVLFGLLMMGTSGVENRGFILGHGIGLMPPSTALLPKRKRKGEEQRRRAVVDDEDQDDNLLTTATASATLKLTRLVDQAREFGVFYTVVSRRISRLTHGHGGFTSAWGGFGGGCEVGDNGIVDVGWGRAGGEGECDEGEQEQEQDQGGSDVVRRVVEFLEELRDGVSS